ncbi:MULTISPECIES: dienelactone hydrolase family protein [unclassified Brevundimonas]|uniref:dienelactone hydrolase family protein n=1 Tax=unclassified Brevundimonas TaxID=2622653 RepID=UPI0006F73D60|nr:MULTISPECIES: dienelactone hydrolase family protein [unclassified Brevundimonas]KQY95560.1 dienelactone hydrolase [Brevundimonas sp. Root1423]KRA28283.1 dienelactone hydrolase [Brevundimonas sp. Root608]
MTNLIRPEGPEADDFRFSRRALATGVVGGLAFAGYAPAALARQAAPITTSDDNLTIEQTTYPAPDGFALPAYIARPTGDGPYPVVVVVSEIFGVHEYIRDVCRRLARAGYAAIAPAFFVRTEDPAPLSDMARIQQIVAAASYEQVMGDIAATLDWASSQLWANADKVGITGWCWGGKVVWQAAARFAAIDAGVAWYGRLAPAANATPEQAAGGRPWPVDLADDLKAPVLGLYGEADRGIPLDSVEAMRSALQRAGQTDSRIDVYPAAPHGFHADYRDSYRAADAADGWSKLLALFEARLKT